MVVVSNHLDALTTAAVKEARKSLAALLLELPHEVWRSHKGTVENAIVQMVEELGAVAAERDRLRSALTRSEQAHAADAEVCAEVRGQLRSALDACVTRNTERRWCYRFDRGSLLPMPDSVAYEVAVALGVIAPAGTLADGHLAPTDLTDGEPTP